MIERFLRYSLEKGRPVRLIWQDDDGSIKQANIQVTAFDGDQVTFVRTRPKGLVTCPVGAILSADYKKGDDGQE